MSDPMVTAEAEAHEKFFIPLPAPVVDEVPAGLKTYVSTFLSMEESLPSAYLPDWRLNTAVCRKISPKFETLRAGPLFHGWDQRILTVTHRQETHSYQGNC